ncbi:hypothetical protein Cmtc_54870 [Cupriavidus sp. TKC]|nr:hypothetical protein Cmtc_54870 [Cupriavidus sp. TKC]
MSQQRGTNFVEQAIVMNRIGKPDAHEFGADAGGHWFDAHQRASSKVTGAHWVARGGTQRVLRRKMRKGMPDVAKICLLSF